MTDNRELDPTQPVAIDDKDPGNADPDEFTAPLDPDDNVFTLVNADQGDLLETTPVGEDRP
jgi:hypothetical protein